MSFISCGLVEKNHITQVLYVPHPGSGESSISSYEGAGEPLLPDQSVSNEITYIKVFC